MSQSRILATATLPGARAQAARASANLRTGLRPCTVFGSATRPRHTAGCLAVALDDGETACMCFVGFTGWTQSELCLNFDGGVAELGTAAAGRVCIACALHMCLPPWRLGTAVSPIAVWWSPHRNLAGAARSRDVRLSILRFCEMGRFGFERWRPVLS